MFLSYSTDDAVINAMLRLAEVRRRDIIYDLGAGDGRILITAAKFRGARGIGIEIDPLRIADAMESAGDANVEYLVDFIEEDIFTADFSEATVVTLYLLDSVNLQLRPRLLSELRPGTRIVSHAFGMGDWEADEKLELGGITIHKWVVPAQIAGAWEWEGVDGTPYYVELEQKFQEITGKAWRSDEAAELESAHLSGTALTLQIRDLLSKTVHSFTLHFENNELQSVEEE